VEENKIPLINELFNKFERAKSNCSFEPILRGSLNFQGANHQNNMNKNDTSLTQKPAQHINNNISYDQQQ